MESRYAAAGCALIGGALVRLTKCSVLAGREIPYQRVRMDELKLFEEFVRIAESVEICWP